MEKNDLIIDPALGALVKKFLKYSFNDIDFKYDGLTKTEASLCTPEEYERLVAWVRS